MTDEHRLTLSHMPPMMRTLARGLLRRRSGIDPTLPTIHATVAQVSTPASVLTEYRALCGLPDTPDLPILWPQILAGPLHMTVLAHRAFPWSSLGIVHMGQSVTRHAAIPAHAAIDLSVVTGDAQPTKRGARFGLTTQAHHNGQLVWQSDMLILAPGKHVPGDVVTREPLTDLDEVLHREVVHVPENIGRRYRRVSGDANPIHMHRLTAKLFGFKRAIAHGTWTLARAVGTLPDTTSLTARFIKPVFLPSTIDIVSNDHGHIQVRDHDSDRLLVDIHTGEAA